MQSSAIVIAIVNVIADVTGCQVLTRENPYLKETEGRYETRRAPYRRR